MHPILFNIGSLPIYSYSVYLTAGCLMAMAWTMREARLKELPFTMAPVAGIIAIVSGLVGARALYVALYSQEFIHNPVEILYIWQGGLVFSGAFLFGSLSGLLFLKSQKQPLLQWLDCIAPGVALGQTIGRLGCFFAGCCYGKTTSLPWGVTFSDPGSLAPIGHLLHPTQLYHSLAGLLTFVILLIAKNFIKSEGGLTGLFLILFSVCRFIIEFFRADYRGELGPFSLTQFFTLIFFSIGIYLLFIHKHRSA
ncbi:phosphatidylglycerol:prolipoprotein diacylglycerol transferase [Maridesulfovibrio ferrireducens]|uniref:Phosphatidylglycerol--prolipoprotein diacylglyceryl transferase n=1 Tax=Maridesulfovibrio ferrireducens TaxID=246191 RepID=A0A1G9I6K4_9BACT|nr:prolipoprotein diacylglyceryl transferase [Maridesulfovibrio ferrireducens]SDL20851.1 phosphatidylglycerol:prolipoprotein diacylglycerol transferase [Maridesulfovibrio ferrireducens]